MNYSELKRVVLHQMKSIYYKDKVPYIDWMGYKITDDNKPSYHHIVKAEDLKKNNESTDATVDNGAYLGKRSHEMLHALEEMDYELYLRWNDLFTIINKSMSYPDKEIWSKVYLLQSLSENILYKRYETNRKR